MDGSQEEDEILIQEHTESPAVFAPLPSQWSQTQPDEAEKTTSFSESHRKSRRQQRQQQSFSHELWSPEEETRRENEFASLEAMMEDSSDEEQPEMEPSSSPTKYTAKEKHADLPQLISGRVDSPVAAPAAATFASTQKIPDPVGDTAHPTVNYTKSPLPEVPGMVHTAAMPPDDPVATTAKDDSLRFDTNRSSTKVSSQQTTNTATFHQRRRGFQQCPPTIAPSLLETSNVSSILDKNRRFVQSQTSKKPKKQKQKNVKRPQGTVAVSNPKAIVGTRPTHWGTSSTSRPRTNLHRQKGMQGKRKLDIASALSRSGKPRALRASATPRVPSAKRSRSSFLSKPETSTPTTLDPIEEDAEEEVEDSTSPPISFAPSFVAPPTTPQNPNTTTCVDSIWSPSGGGGGSPRRSVVTAGRLSKRLVAIQNAAKGDKIRFQSGQYPFKLSSLDTNDPRNRAHSYMDVTLLGSAATGAAGKEKLTLLGYVHVFSHQKEAAAIDRQLVWICLGRDTANEQKVGYGTQLRIYNALPIPLATSLVDASKDPLSSKVQWIVLCTDLCEPYPSALPPLPDTPSILRTLREGRNEEES